MATAGLFNMLGGEGEAAMQRQLDEQRATKFAEMTQDQRFANMGYSAGAGLGRGIAGAFGVDVRDPEIKAAAMKQRIASDIDYTNLDSVKKGIKSLAEAGFSKDAQDLTKALEASELNKANITAKTAEKLTPEQKNAERLASLKLSLNSLKNADQTNPAVMEAISRVQAEYDALSGLTAKPEAKISFGPDAERISKELYGTSFDKLEAKQAAVVNKKVQEQDIILKATGAPKQTVINAQENSFAKQRGEMQAKSLAEAETQAKSSANAVNRLAGMEKLNQGSLITGPLAGTAIGAGQFLSSLGLLSPQSASTLASSEVYDKQAKDLVMQDLGGKLGAQISDADRQFIEARIPQLKNSVLARAELIGKLKDIHKKNIDYYQRMSKHANAKGSLNDFDFASSAPDTGPALGTKENPIKLK